MLLTADEAAEMLRVKPHRIYALAREGRLPGCVRIGRQLRLTETALMDFIRNGGQALPGGWRREPAAPSSEVRVGRVRPSTAARTHE